MSILNVIGMIPKGGRFANAVVNKVHHAVKDWKKFKEAVSQIEDLLKQGKLKLDGKQKTIFESNKNILKNHEKTLGKKEGVEGLFKKKKTEDPFQGWNPGVIENKQNLPPYTKEMERIDNLMDDMASFRGLSRKEKDKLMDQLEEDYAFLIDKGRKAFDFSKLSLGEIHKRLQGIQTRIREVADNPNIPGDVYKGPKKDMIAAIYEAERPALELARTKLIKAKNLKKYGKKYPVLDPENDAFIVMGLDESGNPLKMSRFVGKFSASPDKTTGKWSKSGTSFYDKWNAKTGTLRKEGEEVFHETLNREGKVIMSNPNYKVPRTRNLDINQEIYRNTSTSDLAKQGYQLKEIDMIVKGRIAKNYLNKTRNKDHNIAMHEQTPESSVVDVMEDLYQRGDDVYKMTLEQWTDALPKYFAGGGYVPGYATGGVANLFRKRK
jgi:hypothetical protein